MYKNPVSKFDIPVIIGNILASVEMPFKPSSSQKHSTLISETELSYQIQLIVRLYGALEMYHAS